MVALPRTVSTLCKLGVLWLAWFTFAVPSAAADSPLKLEMQAYLVTAVQEGDVVVEKLAPLPEGVAPAQTILYRIRAANNGDQALGRVQLIGPVPAGTFYLAGTAHCAAPHRFTVSIDDGLRYVEPPVVIEVVTAEGATEEQVVPPDRYTHIKFTVDSIAPGQTVTADYRVTVR